MRENYEREKWTAAINNGCVPLLNRPRQAHSTTCVSPYSCPYSSNYVCAPLFMPLFNDFGGSVSGKTSMCRVQLVTLPAMPLTTRK